MTPSILPFFAGLALGGSLIVAIGAQNAFILKQGLRRHHVFPLCLACALSDAVLIWLGAYTLSAIADKAAVFATVARYVGAAFLIGYGLMAAWKAFSNRVLETEGQDEVSLGRALAICLGFTFLNPHVYLDTVVLTGSMASTYQPESRWAFCLGATTASFLWFFALGYGARLLTPIFTKPLAWRILDAVIAAIMLTLGAEIAAGL